MNTKKIEEFARRRVGLTEEQWTKSMNHLVSCNCHCCRRLEYYFTIKEAVEEWELYKEGRS